MKFIRDRADARLLPSRYRFAIFRLFAWLKLQVTPPRPRPGLALAVDRDQSAIEHHLVAWGFFLAMSAFVAAVLSTRMNTVLAALCAIAIAAVLVEIPMFALAGLMNALMPGRRNSGAVGVATFTPLLLASIYFAMASGWPRAIAWIVLILVAINILAACVLWLFRDRIRDAERRFAA